MIVAIDGPAAAGKSSLARALAARIGAGYLDTGAMYRAVTWLGLSRGVSLDDGPALGRLAADHPTGLVDAGDGLTVEIAGQDVTEAIRQPAITAEVSRVSAHPDVRRAVVAAQRIILAEGDWVADGRDIGTVVAPAADVKVFLTARVEVRAQRRHAEMATAGGGMSHREVMDDLLRRDHLDSSRETDPLMKAEDAIELDTSDLTPGEVVDRLVEMTERARGR